MALTTVALLMGLVACEPQPSTARAQEANDDSARAQRPETDEQPREEARPSEKNRNSASSISSGKAVFPEMEHDFGDVEQGETVTHLFKVRNEGEEVLHIKRVRGS